MAAPYKFPDPNDRSVNEPHVLLESAQILGLYNQANPGQEAKYVSAAVIEWVKAEARRQGWSTVTQVGNSVVLEAAVVVTRPA